MTTMSDDELCKRLRAQKDSGLPRMGGGSISYDPSKSTSWISPPIMVAVNPDGPTAAALIEALIAERDAAVARATAAEAKECEIAEQYGNAERDGIAEGERRATAAIVADLRKAPSVPRQYHDLADRYEHGDHITEAKP